MNTLRSLVYDAPTRWFHWLFAALFVTAFGIANLAEDSWALPLHMLAGLMLATLVVLRFFWGFIGTRHARFSDFALNPRSLFSYFRNLFASGGVKWPGHNPASSWAAMIMIALASGLAITGVLMTGSGGREAYEELHEVLANSFLVIALMHVAGVILHSSRHRDGFASSMLDGRKPDVPEGAAIASARPVAALLMLALMAMAGYVLWKGYEPGAGTLRAFGVTLQLGENEAEQGRHAHVRGELKHESAGEDD